jgi:serine beta-lactamase-like protein LACTB
VTNQRLAFIAAIAGLVGGALTLLGWRLFARQLLAVPAVAADSVPQCSKTPEDERHAQSIRRARPPLLAMMRERRIPGMSVTVAVDGQIVWSEGFGYADMEKRVPACPDTRFRIGSVSKPITATMMVKLAEEGRLDIDAPVHQYLPSYPGPRGITLRHLASHRSGIRHYRDDQEAFTQVQFKDLRESLALFQNDPVLFAPDTRHEYSSYGYALLGAAMEAVAEQEFGMLVQRFAQSIGMNSTTVDRNDSTLVGLTRFYDHVTPYVTDGQVHRSPFVAMSSKWAGGGIISTTEDLARFGSALLPNAEALLLADTTRELLFTSRSRLGPPIIGYALGWMTMRDMDLRKVYMHFGAGSGTTSWLGVFPDEGVVVAVLANLGHAGFTYASTIGVGSRFMSANTPALTLVFAIAFVAFAGATAVIVLLVQLFARLRATRRT